VISGTDAEIPQSWRFRDDTLQMMMLTPKVRIKLHDFGLARMIKPK